MNNEPVNVESQLLLLQALLYRREAGQSKDLYLSDVELQVLLQVPFSTVSYAVHSGHIKIALDAQKYRYEDVLQAVLEGGLASLNVSTTDAVERLQAYRQLVNLKSL